MWKNRNLTVLPKEQERVAAALGIINHGPMDLASTSLELTDPTPNIYELFTQFNQRFFWGRLTAVAVRWSKRMYRCAGICRYKGREGFCEIALSEPLLKLRSRKNLVETLLHEMIHAFLFVTDNDRDRDGHGPKFHEHMYRINKEANVNITVYHNFTDEVQLYQTHWWRCDGPCRTKSPFFGIVRRTCNRAPGPSDFWHNTHKRTCGGTFIKIKEPEKKQSKKPVKIPAKSPMKDIRSFFKIPGNKQKIQENIPTKKRKINGTNSKNDEVINLPKQDENINTNNMIDLTNNVLKTVRDHWNKKFNPEMEKPKSNEEPKSKRLKKYEKIIQDVYGDEIVLTEHNFKPSTSTKREEEEEEIPLSECPVCITLVHQKDLEAHVATCVEASMSTSDEYFDQTDVQIIEPKVDVIDLTCLSETSFNSKKDVECPVCNKKFDGDLENHLEICLDNTFEDDDEDLFTSDGVSQGDNVNTPDSKNCDDDTVENSESTTQFPCPCCLNLIEETDMNSHLDECLD